MFGAGIFFLLFLSYVGDYAFSQEITKVKMDTNPPLIEDEEHPMDDEDIQEHFRYSPEKVNFIWCKRYNTLQISKVVRGRNAQGTEFPHMALLGYGEINNISWACGGSLISQKFVLTAGHCLKLNGKIPVQHVRLGDLDIKSDTDDAQPQQFTVKKTYSHPSFKSPSRYHDIGLLQLDRKVEFTRYVLPACIGLTQNLDGTNPSVAGWGLLRRGGSPANILQTAPMEYVSAKDCSKTFPRSIKTPRSVVDDIVICAGGGTNKTDTCQGDSGGPLQIINYSYDFGPFPEIVGITSYGKSCGFLAGMYTRISPYIPWIEENVWSYAFKSSDDNI